MNAGPGCINAVVFYNAELLNPEETNLVNISANVNLTKIRNHKYINYS